MLIKYPISLTLLGAFALCANAPQTPSPQANQAPVGKTFSTSFTGYGIKTIYETVVAPSGKILLRLAHPNIALLKLDLSIPGDVTPLLNLAQQGVLRCKGNNEAWFYNSGNTPKTIRIQISDKEKVSGKESPYTVEIVRDWDPSNEKSPQEPRIVERY